MKGLEDELRDRILRSGPLTFEAFMALALYHPDGGYYATRVPGAGGDYGTSPALTPWFGRLVAREFAGMWEAMGRPSTFTVVESGAGRADLAAAALEGAGDAAGADLAGVLRWRIVERFPAVAALQRDRLGPLAELVTWSDQLAVPAPEEAGMGCVLAHEVLDNFPVHAFETQPGGAVAEVYVDVEGERLVERLGPVSDPGLRDAVLAAAAQLPPGRRFEVCAAYDPWLRAAAMAIEAGYLLILDYGDVEPDLWAHHPQGSVVTYGPDGMGDDPLADPGGRDVTAEVNFSAVERAARRCGFEPDRYTTQREWLASLGHGALVDALDAQAATAASQGRTAESFALSAEAAELAALVARLGYGDIMVFRAALPAAWQRGSSR